MISVAKCTTQTPCAHLRQCGQAADGAGNAAAQLVAFQVKEPFVEIHNSAYLVHGDQRGEVHSTNTMCSLTAVRSGC
jgi:hypothetical protein